jgi:hypothetical protein
MHILAEFVVIVCLCMYLPDDDHEEVETCTRNIRDKSLFITKCEFFYQIVYVLDIIPYPVGISMNPVRLINMWNMKLQFICHI